MPRSDLICLSHTLYRESRGELPEASKAVLEVVLNRMTAKHLSACSVVVQHRQFAWWHFKYLFVSDKKMLTSLYNVIIMEPVLNDEKYLWFYSGKKPKWTKEMTCRKISTMYFCKLKEN